jgi:hypothetical protein
MMMEKLRNRRAAWTPPPRPDWVARVNAEGSGLDIAGIVPLDADSLIATAVKNTGLDDFGDDDWREPFELICKGLQDEAALNLMGRIMTRSDMLMLLEGRLRIEEAYRRHPEIEDEQILSPILITGSGRTGTSALLNLMAMDPGTAVTRTWQALFPGIPGGQDEASCIAIADARMKMWSRVTPEMEAIHEWSAEVPTESIHVECLSFRMPSWQNIYGQSPSHTRYMATRSKVPAIAYEKRLLKLLQWRQPKRRWVLKSPDALNYLPDVLAVYPDITFAWLHRDPIAALASAVSLVGTLAWARSDRILSEGTFGSVADPLLAANMLSQPIVWIKDGVLPAERLINLYYDDLLADPLAMVAQIYQFCGREMTAEGRAAMQDYLDRHPRTERPAHRYDTGDDDTKAAERQAFRLYHDYFKVKNEL